MSHLVHSGFSTFISPPTTTFKSHLSIRSISQHWQGQSFKLCISTRYIPTHIYFSDMSITYEWDRVVWWWRDYARDSVTMTKRDLEERHKAQQTRKHFIHFPTHCHSHGRCFNSVFQDEWHSLRTWWNWHDWLHDFGSTFALIVRLKEIYGENMYNTYYI